ncbi:MAG: ORF6N domain-containing protein [Prevotellaceae bacterium]|nr:ORF6N domain-containing protein [Prevotellaceae bacterium]
MNLKLESEKNSQQFDVNLLPIKNLIYEIRGQKVMLDFDLAEMYEVETRRLKEQVRRNIDRFPSDFMFQLAKSEWHELIANCDNLPDGIKFSPTTPFAFTQEGVAMLSGILRSPVAVATNIRIMRAFVAVRKLILNPISIDKATELQREVAELKQYVEDVFADYNDINEDTRLQLEQINDILVEMQMQKQPVSFNKPRRRIGFYSNEQRDNNEDLIE